MRLLVGVLLGVTLSGVAVYFGARTARAEFPAVPAADDVYPVVAHLACHYIENLPKKPETNRALLLEYVRAYKTLHKAVNEVVNYDNFDITLLEEPAR